ncbi:MAG: hypothetical protein ICV67_07125 [Thermoleophilia bacterium]|nr:hypothetical protein [Thermoleophilia bacterium]
MFLVYDNATNNVLAEYESFQEAEQRRIQIVEANPVLASVVEVVDLDRAIQARRAEVEAREAS